MATRTLSPTNAFLITFLITVWDSSFVVFKIALTEGLASIAIATFRLLIASAFFLITLSAKKS